MSRNVALALIVACLFASMVANPANAETRGILGIGIGAVSAVGTPVGDENGPSQLFTFRGEALFGPSDWFLLAADVSIGLPHTYDGLVAGGGAQEVEVQMVFFDGLVGVYKVFSDGGFIYLGGGLTVASADVTDTRTDPGDIDIFETDFGASLGFVYGLGLGLPISEDIFGFVSARQRFVTGEGEIRGPGFRADQDVSLGGFDMAVGVGFGFGLD
ncbi:MAG: hypothetical protein OEN01_08080 [Candidatus Krumholzibacteria bacterium]|nr:hypothetical protein [Candidatus Krumholzibacteria bacterium]